MQIAVPQPLVGHIIGKGGQFVREVLAVTSVQVGLGFISSCVADAPPPPPPSYCFLSPFSSRFKNLLYLYTRYIYVVKRHMYSKHKCLVKSHVFCIQ